MTNILVTGATGHLGGLTVEHLLDHADGGTIAALARDPSRLAHFSGRGVDVRRGDYADRASLERAFSGVEKLLFISTTAFSDAIAHHRNVIDAASAAGVEHIHYTSVQHRPGSGVVISQVTDWEAYTIDALARSGMTVTLLRNSVYLDSLPLMLGDDIFKDGIRVPATSERVAFVARDDLAEANAIILTTDGHGGRDYTLGGSEAVSMPAIASILSAIRGTPVGYEQIPPAAFVAYRVARGFPEEAAAFLADWFQAISAGEFSEVTGELARIIGREPITAREYLVGAYAATPVD